MDAKSNTNFNNSAAGGQLVFCSACGAQNTPDCRFCTSCGSKLVIAPTGSATPAFQPVINEAAEKPVTGQADRISTTAPATSTAPVFQRVAGGLFGAAEDPDTPVVSDAPAGSAAPAFQSVDEETSGVAHKPEHHSEGEKIEKYIEPASVFADGLPPWDIVPPQVMVRRRRKK